MNRWVVMFIMAVGVMAAIGIDVRWSLSSRWGAWLANLFGGFGGNGE